MTFPAAEELTPERFAGLLGVEAGALPPACVERLKESDFRYRPIAADERDKVILEILEAIGSLQTKVSGDHRKDDWDRGWGENLRDFVASGFDLESLVPRYFKPGTALRLQGRFILPNDHKMELNFIKALRAWVANRYLSGYPEIFEFGCGTGYHLADLSRQLPGAFIHGLDWAAPSREIVALLAEKLSLPLAGHGFDYFAPDEALPVGKGAAVFTFASLEQVGPRHGAFLDFLLRKRPGICVHVECLEELYDRGTLMDYLASEYHRRRNYLQGFLGAIRKLEAEGRAEILEVRRLHYGNRFHEAYSLLAWRPR
jgi:hypothetical protein